MASLTQVCKDLSIGKPRLYALLDRLNIEPEKVGNRRILDDDQVQRIQAVIREQTDRKPTETVQDRPQTDHEPSAKTSTDSNTNDLVLTLRDQISHLKELLGNEQSERQQERQERSNYQLMILQLQKDLQGVRAENAQLQLEHQTSFQAAEPPKDFEDIEEGIQQVDPAIATAGARSSRMGWFALTIAMITALGWFVLQQAPDVQIKLSELVQ